MLEIAGLVRTAPPWFVSAGAVPSAFTGPVAALLLKPSAWNRAGTTKVVSSFSGLAVGEQVPWVVLGVGRGATKLFWILLDIGGTAPGPKVMGPTGGRRILGSPRQRLL